MSDTTRSSAIALLCSHFSGQVGGAKSHYLPHHVSLQLPLLTTPTGNQCGYSMLPTADDASHRSRSEYHMTVTATQFITSYSS